MIPPNSEKIFSQLHPQEQIPKSTQSPNSLSRIRPLELANYKSQSLPLPEKSHEFSQISEGSPKLSLTEGKLNRARQLFEGIKSLNISEDKPVFKKAQLALKNAEDEFDKAMSGFDKKSSTKATSKVKNLVINLFRSSTEMKKPSQLNDPIQKEIDEKEEIYKELKNYMIDTTDSNDSGQLDSIMNVLKNIRTEIASLKPSESLKSDEKSHEQLKNLREINAFAEQLTIPDENEDDLDKTPTFFNSVTGKTVVDLESDVHQLKEVHSKLTEALDKVKERRNTDVLKTLDLLGQKIQFIEGKVEQGKRGEKLQGIVSSLKESTAKLSPVDEEYDSQLNQLEDAKTDLSNFLRSVGYDEKGINEFLELL